MFLSAEELNKTYGVDPRIAQTYVDRPVPVGNAYWKGRLLYMPPVPGFLFMPLFSDLCMRCGIPQTSILSEGSLSLAERILDSAARLENKEIDEHAHVDECLLWAADATGPESGNWQLLASHLGRGDGHSPAPLRTDYPSLKRADSYLLSLCPIPIGMELFLSAAKAWRSLMSFLLVQDDLADIREDLELGQENAFIEAGLNRDGVDKVMARVDEGLSFLHGLNPLISDRLSARRKRLNVDSILAPYFR